MSVTTQAHNAVADAIRTADQIPPPIKKVKVKAVERDGEAFDQFIMVGLVKTITRFDGKRKSLDGIDSNTLLKAAFDLDFAASLGAEGLLKAYAAALASYPADARLLYRTYVGLLGLCSGLLPSMDKAPSPFNRYTDGHIPEIDL